MIRTRPRQPQTHPTKQKKASSKDTSHPSSQAKHVEHDAMPALATSYEGTQEAHYYGSYYDSSPDGLHSPALTGTTAVASPEMAPLHFDDNSWPKSRGSLPYSPRPTLHSHSTTELQRTTNKCVSSDTRGLKESRPPYITSASNPVIPHRGLSMAGCSCRTVGTAASTQIGEIPLHRWNSAPDYDGISALNAAGHSCANGNMQYAQMKDERKKTPRKGFFAKVFRRVPVAEANANKVHP